MTERYFLFGAGYSARAFARTVAGKAMIVGGTTRSPAEFDALRGEGIPPFRFDGTAAEGPLSAALATASHLVISAGPGEDGDPVLRGAGDVIADGMPSLQWIGYLSTVGVYGDHGGAWVDEGSACRPVSARSLRRVAAEQAWLTFAAERKVPLAILRLAGIYGPGRNTFVNLQNGTARRIARPGQVFNRIHVDDIAAALSLLGGRRMEGIFNVADDEPAPPQDVVAFAARIMGIEPPPEIAFTHADMSPMARSFYGESKKVSNRRISAAGLRLAYPDYRQAFEIMWRSGSWRPAAGTSHGESGAA